VTEPEFTHTSHVNVFPLEMLVVTRSVDPLKLNPPPTSPAAAFVFVFVAAVPLLAFDVESLTTVVAYLAAIGNSGQKRINP